MITSLLNQIPFFIVNKSISFRQTVLIENDPFQFFVFVKMFPLSSILSVFKYSFALQLAVGVKVPGRISHHALVPNLKALLCLRGIKIGYLTMKLSFFIVLN